MDGIITKIPRFLSMIISIYIVFLLYNNLLEINQISTNFWLILILLLIYISYYLFSSDNRFGIDKILAKMFKKELLLVVRAKKIYALKNNLNEHDENKIYDSLPDKKQKEIDKTDKNITLQYNTLIDLFLSIIFLLYILLSMPKSEIYFLVFILICLIFIGLFYKKIKEIKIIFMEDYITIYN